MTRQMRFREQPPSFAGKFDAFIDREWRGGIASSQTTSSQKISAAPSRIAVRPRGLGVIERGAGIAYSALDRTPARSGEGSNSLLHPSAFPFYYAA